MVKVYREIDERLSKNKHDRAIGWLQDAIYKVEKYTLQVKDMKKECREICQSVSSRKHDFNRATKHNSI
jgi:hypothetical protein